MSNRFRKIPYNFHKWNVYIPFITISSKQEVSISISVPFKGSVSAQVSDINIPLKVPFRLF